MPVARWCARAAASAFVLSASFAIAQPSKRECVSLNESGQELRQARKLHDARERFQACTVPSCPQVVRDDCRTRLLEVEHALPTIKLSVKDSHGKVVQPSRLTIDGHARTPSEAIRVIEVDPGEHVIEIGAEGYGSVAKTLSAREGVKNAEEVFVLPEATQSSALASDPPPAPSSSQKLVAFGVGGAGVILLGIGTYFGFASKSTYDDASSPANCPRGPTSCNSAGIDGGKTADEQATISTVMFVGGALFLAGGIALCVTSPEKRTVSVAPRVGTTATGVAATMTW